MLYKVVIVLSFSCNTLLLFSQSPPFPQADTVIHVQIENKQEAINTVNTAKPEENKKKPLRCSKLSGNDLTECIHALTKQKRKKLLKKLSKQQRAAYIKNLTSEQYNDFLNLFTEAEWQTFIAQLSNSEKKQWPKTIQEQKEKLKAIRENADKDFKKQIFKTCIFDLIMFSPIPPAAGLIAALDACNIANHSIEDEMKKTKEYIEEKFG